MKDGGVYTTRRRKLLHVFHLIPFIPLLVSDVRVDASFRECSVYYAVYMRLIPVRLSEPHPSFSLIRCAAPHEGCSALVDADA